MEKYQDAAKKHKFIHVDNKYICTYSPDKLVINAVKLSMTV